MSRNVIAFALALALALSLVACHSNKHGGKREDKSEEDDEEEKEEEAFGVPIPTCGCAMGNDVVALHAPRAGRVLWWFGVKRGKSAKLDELAVFSGGQHVISPDGAARMLVACDSAASVGGVALVREDAAAAWKVAPNAKNDAILLWSVKLPKPLDTTGIDAPLVTHTASNVGCMNVTQLTGGAFDVRLQGGLRGTLSLRDGKWTPAP